MNFFETIDVVKQYAHHKALDKVSIKAQEGRIFGLLGPNGAGKTTLIRIINQITAPDSGQVFFMGETLKPQHVNQIGYLPEERGLYKKMKIGEHAVYLARLKGLNRRDALTKLKYWFEKFEIQSWWDKKVEELSKGMQQKVQFIVTVLHNPRLLIFDEPFSGFDPINAQLLKNEILELRKQGATIIFSTHNMSSVEEICDDIALINQSKVILSGEVHEIRQRYKSDITEVQFFGKFDKTEAAFNARYDIVDYKQQQKSHIVRFRMKNNLTVNELITDLLPLGQISSVNEVIPSMNEIFIRTVQENDQTGNLAATQKFLSDD